MWQVLPRLGLIKLLFLLVTFVISFLSIWAFYGFVGVMSLLTGDGLNTVLAVVTPVMILTGGIIFILGKWGWKCLWKIPKLALLMNKKVCPNLNGKWQGNIASSFRSEDGERVNKPVIMTIKADLFGFDITLDSVDKYQHSVVIQSSIYKDSVKNLYQLGYIFRATVDNAKATDDRSFEGAAILDIRFNENDKIELNGTYWTNRAWQRGLQTAGNISLTRV